MVDQKRVEVSGLAYPWICFFSLKDGKKYYVNASTGSSQWHKPPDAKKDSMRIYTETDLPYPFIALKSASKGQTYYSDARTRKSVWERPKVAALEPPGPPPEAPPIPGPAGDASTSSSTTSIPAAAPVKRELKRSFQKSSTDNEQPSKTSACNENGMEIEPVRNENVRGQSNAASTSKMIKTEPGLKRRPVETKQAEIQVQHATSDANSMQCADVDMPTSTSNSDAKHMSKEMEELLQRLEQEYVEENTQKTFIKSEPVPVWDAVVKQQQAKNTKSPPKKKQPPKDQKLQQSPKKNQKKDQKPPLPLKSQKSPQKKPIKLADIAFPALPSQPQSSQRNSEKVSGVAFPAVPPQDIHYPGSVYDSFDFVLPNGPRPGMKPTKRAQAAQKPQPSAVKQPLDRLLLPKLLSLKPCPSFNKKHVVKSEKPQPSAVKQPLDRLLLPKLLSLKPCPSFNKKSEKKVHPAPPSIRPREPPAVTARPTEAEKKEQVQDVLKELRRIVVGTTPMDADSKLLKADMKSGDPSCSTDVEMVDVDFSGEVQMMRRGAEESDSKLLGSSSTSDMAISSPETKVEVQKSENQMIPFVVVTDTSALVESVDTLPRLVKRDIFTYIPHAVIRELDNLKSVEETPKQRSLAARTRTVVNQIFSYTQDTEPTFAECVVLESNQAGNAPLSGFDCTSNDDRILRAAVRLKHILREQAAGLQVPVILLTNDRILCLKATAYAEQGVFGTNWQGLEKHIQEWKQGKGLIFSMPSSSKCPTENPKLRLSEEADRMPSPPRSRKAKSNRFKEALYDTSVPAPTMLAVVKDELRPIESQLEHFKTIVKQTVDELLRRFHDSQVPREQKEALVLRMTDIRTAARCSCDFPSKYNLFVGFMGAINKAFRFMDGPPEYTAKVGNLKLLHQHILVQHPDVFSDLSNLAHSQEFQIELGISSSDYGF